MSEEKKFTIVCPKCNTEYRVSPEIIGKKVACKRCEETFVATRKNVSPGHPSRIGELAVKYNLITRQQLSEALAEEQGDDAVSLESVLLGKNLLTAYQIETLKLTDLFWKATQISRQWGALAVEKGTVTEAELKAALEKQALLFKETKTIHHVKDILSKGGHLSDADSSALAAALEKSTPDPAREDKTAPERGEASIEEIEQFYLLTISEDKMSASFHPKTKLAPPVSVASVQTFLKFNGITHGIIDDDELASSLSSPPGSGTPNIIARGTPPEPGVGAVIRHHFSTSQKVGTVGEKGHIDFKDKGDVPFVRQGDLLLEKVPAIPGKPGIDVFGNVVAPATPADVKLLPGSGTQLSEDKLKVFAKTDGQPKLSLGGRLSVTSDLVINGDVDLKTGHIDFEGNIKVTGTIQSGFRVKGANISAKEIMGAQIVTSGSITATGGIIGAAIKAQGDVKAKYIKQTTLSTFGDITVQKEIIDSNINTSGACLIPRGKILSSAISAMQGIEAADIGTDVSSPCSLVVGVADHVEAELEGIENAIVRREERLEKIRQGIKILEKQQQATHKEIADLAQIQDRSLLDQRPLKEELGALSADDEEKRRDLEARIAALDSKINDAENALDKLFNEQDKLTQKIEETGEQAEQIQDDILELQNEAEAIRHWEKSQKKAAAVKVIGSVAQGTIISGPHARSVLKDTCRHVTVREVKNTDPDSTVEWEIKIQS